MLNISAHWMLNQVSESSHFYQEMDSVPFFQDEDSKSAVCLLFLFTFFCLQFFVYIFSAAAVGKVISSTCKAAKSIQENGLDTDYHHLFDRASHDLDVAAKYLRYSAEEEINLTNGELVMKVTIRSNTLGPIIYCIED